HELALNRDALVLYGLCRLCGRVCRHARANQKKKPANPFHHDRHQESCCAEMLVHRVAFAEFRKLALRPSFLRLRRFGNTLLPSAGKQRMIPGGARCMTAPRLTAERSSGSVTWRAQKPRRCSLL